MHKSPELQPKRKLPAVFFPFSPATRYQISCKIEPRRGPSFESCTRFLDLAGLFSSVAPPGFFPPGEIKKEKIDHSGQDQTKKHKWIIGPLKNNAHDDWTNSRPKVSKSGKSGHRWTLGGASILNGMNQ